MQKDRAPNFRRKSTERPQAQARGAIRGNTGRQSGLETDLGETTDVAADHPEVVAIGNVA